MSPTGLARLVRAGDADVGVGMVMAHIGFYFVVLTSAAALHSRGPMDIRTAAEAAEALRRGNAASMLFALGLIGIGLPRGPRARGVGRLRQRRAVRLGSRD
ncbi:MAG: divalent metal cation transporter [Dehalococcoidia bacterium]